MTHTDPVLLVGEGELMAGVALCLLNAGHLIKVCTDTPVAFNRAFDRHVQAQQEHSEKRANLNRMVVYNNPIDCQDCRLIVIITPEDAGLKKAALKKLEDVLSADQIIAINTESIDLTELQKDFKYADRLIGLNWSEPAHTTFFLEIIAPENNDTLAQRVLTLAKEHWGKDPYLVKDQGIRSRLITALAREAAYLVQNGYASVADIDRACRNDAGYYLPFAGNCRYMDLMGTYAYGMVMKDLNPDLSKDTALPEFMQAVFNKDNQGMASGKGFYDYAPEDIAQWQETMERFSYQIEEVIAKYPFKMEE